LRCNFTFAIAKTSQTEKKRELGRFAALFSLSACNKGLGLAHKVFDYSNAMLALSGIFNSPLRTSPILRQSLFAFSLSDIR